MSALNTAAWVALTSLLGAGPPPKPRCTPYEEPGVGHRLASPRGIHMRRRTMAASYVLLGLNLALLGPAVAHADDESFVSDAQGVGFQFASDNLISMGQSACYFLSRNRDPGQIVERIMRYGSVDVDSAHRFLLLSVNEYCPQYGGRI